MAVPSLVLGAVNLTDWAGVAYSTQVIAEGTSRGAPVPIEVAVKSWLQDGSVVVTQGYDNRTIPLRVKFRGPSLTALANAEAAVRAELGKPNTLTWTPASGPASVFVVVTSSFEESPGPSGDLAEAKSFPFRTYNIRLVCEAFVRSTTETTAAALAATGTTNTLVDNGSATTNWTGTANGVNAAPSVVSGAVGSSAAATFGTVVMSLTRTASITTSATKYLKVDWQAPFGSAPTAQPAPTDWFDGSPLRAYGDGVELVKVAEQVSPTAGFTRTWFYVAAASIAVLRIDSTTTVVPTAGQAAVARGLFVDNIDRTDIKPAIGTNRQLLRTIAVAGSERTRGSIAIEHATSALGNVLAYFFRDNGCGYSPPLRQYRVSGGSITADSALISGSKESINASTTTFDVPVSRLMRGTHLLLAGIGTDAPGVSTGTVTWTATTRLGSTNLGPTYTGTASITVPSGWGIVALGRIPLPTRDVDPASAAVIRITLVAATSGACVFDDGWLFNSTEGRLIQVACGTGSPAAGGSSNRVFIEPPTSDKPRATVRVGFAADRSDSVYPPDPFPSWQEPQFLPPSVSVFTVTTNALDASTTLRHFPRWHSHAAA